MILWSCMFGYSECASVYSKAIANPKNHETFTIKLGVKVLSLAPSPQKT